MKKYPSEHLRRSIFFNAQTMAKADQLAKELKTNRSQLVNRAIEFYAMHQGQ